MQNFCFEFASEHLNLIKAVSPGYSPDQIVMRDLAVHLAAGIAEMEDALDPEITA